jgi:site-specific recombinase XerD
MSEPPIPATVMAAAPRLRELVAAAEAYADNGHATNTRRGYDADLRHFEAWCAGHGGTAFPASGDVLATYLAAHAGSDKVATLAHRLAAIRAAHAAAGWPPPDSARLEAVWRGIRRAHGRPPDGKAALMIDDLRRVLAALPDTLAGKRDRALLLVGFAGALRRSELAALELDGSGAPVTLAFVREGLEIRLARSKADQEGAGAVVGIPLGREPATCGATAVTAWLEAAGISSGPVFRAIDRHGRVGEDGLCARTVARVVKSAVQRVGFDPDAFAGHSLRAGLITSAAVADAPPDVIQRHARHARWDTTQRYVRAGQRFTRNAAGMAGL